MENQGLVLEEIRNKLDRQIGEIRNQRRQAVKILRIYFAAAAILIAAFTTIVSASVSLPFKFQIDDGQIYAPIIVFIGVLISGRGLLGFYKGIFNAFGVLSIESVDSQPNTIRYTLKLVSLLDSQESSNPETHSAALGPKFVKIADSDDPIPVLIDQNIASIQENDQTIKSNNEHLSKVYQRMSSGLTGFAIGLVILSFSL